MILNWKVDETAHENADFGYLGSWRVFSVFNEGMTIRLATILPGLSNDQGKFATRTTAKEKAETLARNWVREAGLRR